MSSDTYRKIAELVSKYGSVCMESTFDKFVYKREGFVDNSRELYNEILKLLIAEVKFG